ncbi:MAG: OmpH family outer membrane protein [Bacteroidales bacterium]|nr:OmpH family outer membrane protein [Bacteroidales bacterium]
MKKTLIAFASAIVMMAVSACQGSNGSSVCVNGTDSVSLSIAYINTDSLLLGYDYAAKLNDQLMSKSEASRADFNQKYRVFQQDAIEFQRKVQNNGFLSMDRAQKEQQRLAKVEQDLQELNDRLANELAQEQARMSEELRDSLSNFLASYAEGRYKLILSTSMINGTVLYSAPGVDITEDIVKALNARYAASQK